jgi:Mrp family chromosome partitioning ATPase
MSAVDRAFIKAYADTPSVRRQPPVEQRDAAGGASGPHEMPRPPRRPFGRPAPVDAQPVTVAMPAATKPTTPAPKAPLSSFVPAPKADLPGAVEVDDLAWPAECLDLIEQARRGFDRFADHLSERLSQDERCIAMAGFCQGDGRTLITLATAKHLATRGIHTLMVDANLANPMLASRLRITPQGGWCEVVANKRSLEESLITSRTDRVTLLPCRGRSQAVAPLEDFDRIAEIFETLKRQYDLLLLDTPALTSPVELARFAALAEAVRLDALYLVRDARSSTHEEMRATCSALQQSHVPVAGIIDNFVAPAELHEWRLPFSLPNFTSRLLASRT